MVTKSGRTVTVFGGTGFLGRRIVRHLRDRGFSVRTRQGIRIGGTDCLVLMIRNCNPSRPIFTTSDRLRMGLAALTAL
jgi:nucleoside-diphosphate-sugar epimerase